MKPAKENLRTTCKILLVDDSKTDRQTYQHYLMKSESVDFVIWESNCGETGLEMCLQHKPDVILLEYLLPDFDGLEFLKALKKKRSPLPPTIMLTDQGNEQIAVEAMKVGAQDYLIKGQLTPDQLVQAVRRVLAQRNLQLTIARQQSQQRLMADVALRISQSLDLEIILEAAVVGIRQVLDCDRTLVYRFESDRSGTVIAESVLPKWPTTLGNAIEDSCFRETGVNRYLSGHKTVICDIYHSGLSTCHIQLLERFQVKANIVVPILVREIVTLKQPRLWGLLMAHCCQDARTWQAYELGILDDLALQLGIAIQHSELVLALEKRAEALTVINHELTIATKQLDAQRGA